MVTLKSTFVLLINCLNVIYDSIFTTINVDFFSILDVSLVFYMTNS